MTDLEEIFKYVNSIDLEKYILFSDLELYNKKAGKSYFYKDYEEVYNDKKIISQIKKKTLNYKAVVVLVVREVLNYLEIVLEMAKKQTQYPCIRRI